MTAVAVGSTWTAQIATVRFHFFVAASADRLAIAESSLTFPAALLSAGNLSSPLVFSCRSLPHFLLPFHLQKLNSITGTISSFLC